MAYSHPAFQVEAQVHHFYIDDAQYGSSKILRCATHYPKKRGAAKPEVLIRYIQPLVHDVEASRNIAYAYAMNFAANCPSQVVTFENTVFFAGESELSFGKYAGKTLNEIFKINPGYIDWLAINMKPRNPIDQRIQLQCSWWLFRGFTRKMAV